MKEEAEFHLRPAYKEEWEESMGLAWKTFLRFEAPDYSEEGIRSFYEFITDTTLHKMFVMGNYHLFVAVLEQRIAGMITLREESHISLLFVDKKYHRRGIGRALIKYLCDYVTDKTSSRKITVNASPYGVAFYHKLGFSDIEKEIVKDGIRYTPMELIVSTGNKD